MAIRNIFILGLLAGVLVIAGCKKTCNFPERQEGNRCWQVRQDLVGSYYGTMATTYPGNIVYRMVELAMRLVERLTDLRSR